MALENSHLYREIHEQPLSLRALLRDECAAIERLAAAIAARNVDYVVIAARGTSDNAGRYAQYVLGAVNGLMVTLATPSLYSIYKRPPRFGNALVLGISQSGKSPDIVSVLAEARRQGALTAAITNFPQSDLG
ncbi:MAG: SIS domain-containing protein, partial [Caldilineaceae bacterium]|nr:SIS domain-containing protein [Caldilineaceae bacterium]